ncbi:CubicO group peptidase (beta-lactamase class C family) [Kribbella amoyensis]|uniref:CubicO group peptidase (Beta-lactamase class C family) n=1 Tax=Kribbella amoyensis TaxID=996641 RepID=A0A561BR29_9ACTN|nr:serine hydrolase domain-containing protein [Kribbella amoyensis]TWD81262.1 CubicO group peptidase (beta-lactamase class C family) [Kribbella amoyensis]
MNSSTLQHLVQDTIDELIGSGAESGLQVAAYHHGELVVDAVGGLADTGTKRPVTSDTPFYSASTGKGVTATLAHVLADRGVLTYDAPIADVWPEFGVRGKDKATLRHVLTHSVGLPGVPSTTTVEDLTDWDRMTAQLAAAEPWWEPGTKMAYHAQTFGFLIGEVIRRATGKPLGQVLAEEVTGPLGVADEVYFGVPATEVDRVARLEDAEGIEEMMAMVGAMFERLAPAAVTPSAAYANRPEVLTADIPAGGTVTARGVAKVYAALLGDVDGVRLVGPERLAEIAGPALVAPDEVLGHTETWALGYSVGRLGSTPEETPDVFGMPGIGGSVAWADRGLGVAFALTRTRFDPTQSASAVRIGELVARTLAG